ncbi:MAG: lipoprotein insertase outer membrane protein LolB, partial [Nitrosomonas sp.]|nr:lipoprotein insertase outer membrane protein LolB [Nitrosomonas sp.]
LRDHEGVRLTTSEQQVFYAADVESLTEDILGWRIPLAGLQYWAQGTHLPTSIAMKDLDEHDRVVAIRQDGWLINYLSYTAQSEQKERPRVLTLNYEALQIRLVVDNWEAQ